MIDRIQTKKNGFTIIETLVVIFIMSIVILVISSAFVQSLRVQRRALNMQQVEENASYVMERVARDIRESTIVGVLPDSCSISTLSLTHPTLGSIVYSSTGFFIHRMVGGDDLVLNSNNVEFTNFEFCSGGTSPVDLRQPRVTILGTLRSKELVEQASLSFQTSVSIRKFAD